MIATTENSFASDAEKNSELRGHFCFLNFDRKFQKKLIDGIYEITLHNAKNLNYNVFVAFSCPKKLSGPLNTINKHGQESKQPKTSILKK